MLLSTLAMTLVSLQGGFPTSTNSPGSFKDLTSLRRTSSLLYQFQDLVNEGKFVEADRFLVANFLAEPPERGGYWLPGALLRYELQDFEEAFQRIRIFRSQFPREEREGNEMSNLYLDMAEAFVVHSRRESPDRAVLAIADAYGVDVEEALHLIMGLGLQYSPGFGRQIIACHRRLAPHSSQPDMAEDRLRRKWGRLADAP